MSYDFGKNAFISYRSAYFSPAVELKRMLEQEHLCKNAVLFEPEELSAYGELLLPYEYVELMGFINNKLARCDTFLFLDTPDYWESYFTQAEVHQWRNFRDSPVIRPVRWDMAGHFHFGRAVTLPTLEPQEKKVWAKFSRINRDNQGHHAPPFATGRYGTNCFIFPCGTCGEHFLVSQKAVRQALEGSFRLQCGHCGNAGFQLSEGEQRSTFYRKPISVHQEWRKALRILEPREIQHLIIDDEPMPRFPVTTLPGETLRGTVATVGRVLGFGALLVGAVAFLWAAAEQRREKNGDSEQ